MKRILYIHPTFVPPPRDPATDRFALMAEHLEGDVVQPVWFSEPAELEAHLGAGSYPVFERAGFRYHFLLGGSRRERGAVLGFQIGKARELLRQRRYDAIVVYSHMTTGLAGVFLKLLSGTPLIVEVATSPALSYLMDRPRPGLPKRIAKLYSDLCLHATLAFADRTHLLFSTALDRYPLLRRRPVSVFHEFVPVSRIERRPGEREPVVLFAGHPWYLKGVDILIRAFRALAPDFPATRLEVVGYFPDGAEIRRLAAGCPQIQILEPIHHPQLMEKMSRVQLLVLPSRCEGMGRVLLEAMAAGIPVVGSDAGGIPHYARNGETGLVFRSGDAGDLEAKLRRLLADPALREQLGERGYHVAHEEMDERAYVKHFVAMVEAAAERR